DSQFQLDVVGELLDTVWVYRQHGGEIDDGFWDFLGRVAGAVIEQWREPDQGIWEIRGEPRHFTYSKVMAWVALDRVVRIAELDGREGALDEWRAERDEVRELIARAGEGERARELFERLLGFCNDVGLLAEEIDPASGELLGNFPQAFSHVGLIQAAIALDMPEESMTMIESGGGDVTES